MNPILCITFRFIQPFPLFHGSGDAGVPEWPPSPMRAFQALVNATSLRYRGKTLPNEIESALMLIEAIRPSILAPDAQPSTIGYRAYVPHNQADLVSAAWHRGNVDASIASHRMEKDIRPIRIEMLGDDLPTIHYLYPLNVVNADSTELLRAIRPSVRSIHCLGWGIDQVIADATLIDDKQGTRLIGERWTLTTSGGQLLRVHRKGSLDALGQRYDRFLGRLTGSDWTPVPPLKENKDFDQVRYRRDTDPLPRPHAVFKLLDANEDTFRYPHAKLIHIAGMVRHLAIERMKDDPPPWIENPPDWVNRVVRGKRDENGRDTHKQFSFVPLPSIGQHADAMIRNVMIVAPIGMERELNHLADRLSGEQMTPEGKIADCEADSKPAVSERIELQRFAPSRGKFIAERYLSTSHVWHTVTPVILDGHNDKKPEKTARLIQNALQRAGIEAPCEFTWQAIPFFKNCLSAHKYDRDGRHTGYHRPAHLKSQTAVHVCLIFQHSVPGPITLGAGRHCGLGVFAAQ